MKYHFCVLVLLILLLGCKDVLEKEQVIFKEYDFSTGNYKLLFYGQENKRIEGFDNFYIDDIETLEKIKKHWIIRYKSDVMPCGYTYAITLEKNNIISKEFLVNLDCEYMTGWFHFPKSYITDYKRSFKKMNLK